MDINADRYYFLVCIIYYLCQGGYVLNVVTTSELRLKRKTFIFPLLCIYMN